MLDDTEVGSDARLLLNVALTRAKSQAVALANLPFLGHLPFLGQQLPPESSLARILALFEEGGERIDSQALVDSYFTRSFAEWTDRASAPGAAPPTEGALYTERSFYAALTADLRRAQREVILLSPFLFTKRSATLADLLSALAQRGVKVRLFTKPAGEQTGAMALHADVVMGQLRAAGVAERARMHQKAAIIDRAVAWEGSLNILSHRDTGEQMRRLPYAAAVSELIRVLDLDDVAATSPRAATSADPVVAVEPCALCGGGWWCASASTARSSPAPTAPARASGTSRCGAACP